VIFIVSCCNQVFVT